MTQLPMPIPLTLAPGWVRWGTFGLSVDRARWVRVQSVGITDGWLILHLGDGHIEMVPQHVVRGPVQIRTFDPPAEEPRREPVTWHPV